MNVAIAPSGAAAASATLTTGGGSLSVIVATPSPSEISLEPERTRRKVSSVSSRASPLTRTATVCSWVPPSGSEPKNSVPETVE